VRWFGRERHRAILEDGGPEAAAGDGEVVADLGEDLLEWETVELVAQPDALVERGEAAEFEVAAQGRLAEQDDGERESMSVLVSSRSCPSCSTHSRWASSTYADIGVGRPMPRARLCRQRDQGWVKAPYEAGCVAVIGGGMSA
jgi:hypothetical protein